MIKKRRKDADVVEARTNPAVFMDVLNSTSKNNSLPITVGLLKKALANAPDNAEIINPVPGGIGVIIPDEAYHTDGKHHDLTIVDEDEFTEFNSANGGINPSVDYSNELDNALDSVGDRGLIEWRESAVDAMPDDMKMACSIERRNYAHTVDTIINAERALMQSQMETTLRMRRHQLETIFEFGLQAGFNRTMVTMCSIVNHDKERNSGNE